MNYISAIFFPRRWIILSVRLLLIFVPLSLSLSPFWSRTADDIRLLEAKSLVFGPKGNNIYIYNIIIVDYIYDMTRFRVLGRETSAEPLRLCLALLCFALPGLMKHRSQHNAGDRASNTHSIWWMLWDKSRAKRSRAKGISEQRERRKRRKFIASFSLPISYMWLPIVKTVKHRWFALFHSHLVISCFALLQHILMLLPCDCLRITTTKRQEQHNVEKQSRQRMHDEIECIRGIGINCMNVFDIDAR